jgi:hypothetical protein
LLRSHGGRVNQSNGHSPVAKNQGSWTMKQNSG